MGRPKGRRGRNSLIVYKGLAKAIRRESEQAICHWFGVCPNAAWKWRKALGVGFATEGTSRLFREYIADTGDAMRALAVLEAGNPERRRKIAESRRGKPRPAHVLEAMHNARRGVPHTEESRQRMSEAHRRRGTLVAGTIPWTAAEDELVKTLPAEEAAQRTGRSLKAVYARRSRLQLPDGRRRK